MSQGFDWQFSPRIPFSHSKFFWGFNASGLIISTTGNFSFLEDHIACCDYESGYGKSIKLGVSAEYWCRSAIALNGSLNINLINSSFKQTIVVPRSDGKNDYFSRYKYFLDESRNYISGDISAKYRILNSHFSAGGGISSSILISSQALHKEKIISPSDETFIDGSKERKITNGILQDYNTILITPSLFINYDLDLGIGYYSSIKFCSFFPLMSVVQNDNWREWKFGFEFQFLKSY